MGWDSDRDIIYIGKSLGEKKNNFNLGKLISFVANWYGYLNINLGIEN